MRKGNPHHRRLYADPAEGLRVKAQNVAGQQPQKRGAGEPALSPGELEIVRQRAFEAVADLVSNAMIGVGHRQLSRRLGRDMGRTLSAIYQGKDTSIRTLADLARATGRELVVEFR